MRQVRSSEPVHPVKKRTADHFEQGAFSGTAVTEHHGNPVLEEIRRESLHEKPRALLPNGDHRHGGFPHRAAAVLAFGLLGSIGAGAPPEVVSENVLERLPAHTVRPGPRQVQVPEEQGEHHHGGQHGRRLVGSHRT